jgi:hypothetical protein
MKEKFPAILLVAATLGLAACSQNTDQQQSPGMAEPIDSGGTAEKMGKQIDQAVLELKQRSQEAEAKLGERLIEAGKALKDGQQNGADATQ